MDKEMRDHLYTQAREWVLQAGEIIRIKIKEPIKVDTKSNANDLVTNIDKYIEHFFAEKIRNTYADHLILSEEGFGDELQTLKGTVWIIDPIDGTMNFVHQKRNFAISLGIYQDGVGIIGFIYNVMEDTLYHAVKGEGAYKNEQKLPKLNDSLRLQDTMLAMNHFWLCENRLVEVQDMQRLVKTIRGTRLYGSAALEFAYTAEGIMDGYIAMGLSPWDIAAGIVILQEVGGVTTDITGKKADMLHRSTIIACNPSIQMPLIQDYLHKKRSGSL